ncbi:MAG: cytochrome b N-terminal domain-containing protein [bacterium]|nr:cytochrome b N-terminal domain-containing protein [bacterium]
MIKLKYLVICLLGIVLPLASFAHSEESHAGETEVFHSSVEIGEGFDVNEKSGGITAEEARHLNSRTVSREEIRSTLKVILLDILIIIVALVFWPGLSNRVNNQFLKRLFKHLHQASFVLGGMVLSMLVLITVTGMILSFLYMPFPELAHDSMKAIVNGSVTSFIRNVHFWASDIFIVVLIVHLSRILFTKVSDKSKRIAYWIGLVMLALVFTEMLFGTFLRSDQEAYEAYAHFWVGAKNMLPQFFEPVITFVLALTATAPFMERPYGTLEITKPPWYLLWVYGLENIWGMKMIVLSPLIVGIILIVLPFLSKREKKIDTSIIVYICIIISISILTMYAALSGEISHLTM